MESFDTPADEVGALESRVADAIFDTVRAQLRAEVADEAKELERRLSKVRRSLQKAEMLLRGAPEIAGDLARSDSLCLAFEEHYKGTLEPGMVADLQVYDRDPLSAPATAWDQLRPAAVLVGGVRVH